LTRRDASRRARRPQHGPFWGNPAWSVCKTPRYYRGASRHPEIPRVSLDEKARSRHADRFHPMGRSHVCNSDVSQCCGHRSAFLISRRIGWLLQRVKERGDFFLEVSNHDLEEPPCSGKRIFPFREKNRHFPGKEPPRTRDVVAVFPECGGFSSGTEWFSSRSMVSLPERGGSLQEKSHRVEGEEPPCCFATQVFTKWPAVAASVQQQVRGYDERSGHESEGRRNSPPHRALRPMRGDTLCRCLPGPQPGHHVLEHACVASEVSIYGKCWQDDVNLSLCKHRSLRATSGHT
jgi:hypothetical protein